jgi:hypothetical protein
MAQDTKRSKDAALTELETLLSDVLARRCVRLILSARVTHQISERHIHAKVQRTY